MVRKIGYGILAREVDMVVTEEIGKKDEENEEYTTEKVCRKHKIYEIRVRNIIVKLLSDELI